MPILSPDQRVKALAFIPRVPACLSIVGSSCIVFAVFSRKNALNEFYHRMMLVLSAFDLIGSVWLALGSVPVLPEYGIPGSFGTTFSCSMQGFFIHFSAIGSSACNAALMVYFVLKVRYNVPDNAIQKWSHCIHISALILSLAMALSGVLLQVMNPIGFGGPSNSPLCYIQAFPPGCDFVDDMQCTRGANANVIIWPIAIIPFILATVVFLAAVATVVWTVIVRDRQSRKFSAVSGGIRPNIVTAVARRCFLYALVFFNTFLWTTVSMIIHNNDPPKFDTFWMGMLAFTFMPMQGFFNLFIYVQPRYSRIRTQYTHRSRIWAFWQALRGKIELQQGRSFLTTGTKNIRSFNARRDQESPQDVESAAKAQSTLDDDSSEESDAWRQVDM